MGWGQLCNLQQDQVPGPELQTDQLHVMLKTWDRVTGKAWGGKGSGSVGQCSTEHEPSVYLDDQEGQ